MAAGGEVGIQGLSQTEAAGHRPRSGFRKPSQTEVGEGVRIGTHGREVQGDVPFRLPVTSADCFSPSLVLPPLPGSLLSLPPGSSPPCPTSSHVATR